MKNSKDKPDDIYQQRYKSHQWRKRNQLTFGEGDSEYRKWNKKEKGTVKELLSSRASQRVFNSNIIEEDVLNEILNQATSAPSSCNRHGISLKVVRDRHEKELLNGLLVGGIGWVYRADTVILLFADPEAYKSPYEKEFMHYCDVGFTVMPMWYTAESLNVGAAYINPNIRPQYKKIMSEYFGKGIFVGAFALGYYDNKAKKATSPRLKEILL